jgi:hypothetical protein
MALPLLIGVARLPQAPEAMHSGETSPQAGSRFEVSIIPEVLQPVRLALVIEESGTNGEL